MSSSCKKCNAVPYLCIAIFLLSLAGVIVTNVLNDNIDRLERKIESDGDYYSLEINDASRKLNDLEMTNDRLDYLELNVYAEDTRKATEIVSNSQYSEFTLEGTAHGMPRFSKDYGAMGYQSILVDVKNRVIIKE